MGFILICCLFVCASPFYVKANTDKATSKAGVIFTHDPENQKLEQMTEAALFQPKFLPKDCRKQEIQLIFILFY